MSDEQQIRDLFSAWLEASMEHQLDRFPAMMTDDVIFLRPGQPPIVGRDAFLTQMRANGIPRRFEVNGQMVEVKVFGDWAYMSAQLDVVVQPATSLEAMHLTGYTLTLLQRVGGRWAIARDANLLAPAVP